MNLLRIIINLFRSLPWPIALLLGCAAIAGYVIIGAVLLIPLALLAFWCLLGLVELVLQRTARAVTTVGSLAPRPKSPAARVLVEIRLFRVCSADYLRARRTWFSCNWRELPSPDDPMPVPTHAFDRLVKEQVPGYQPSARYR